jgi:O-methyltransferase involved in polyketide biosynthesis
MKSESIIDTTRPSAGRIYDYLLGGHHNFEVDRQAADQLVKRLPFLSKAVRLQRWCLQDLAIELAERRGFDVIIDFASGLPTNDHIHHVVPAGTTVIYSDYDPVVVEYAREILVDTPHVHFFHADARRPDDLLSRPAVEEILGGRRRVAMIYWGVSAFLPAEEIAYAARFLHEWSDPSSCWAFHAQGVGIDTQDPNVAQNIKTYAEMGTPLYFRSLDQLGAILHPWRADAPGFIDLLSWHSLGRDTLSPDELRAWGEAGGGYGAYLVK